MRRCLPCVALLLSALLGSGCQGKLNIDKSYSLETGETKFIMVEAPVREQTINVTVNSAGTAVSLYVVPGKDDDDAAQAIREKKGILASKLQSVDPTVEATIPARQPFVVAVESSMKAANVKLKIVSR